ncbi:hypothetical protein IFM51744_02079 [Aspergillus udagawae]|uniref:E3 ubiquitin-protein ligase CHFR n=1 Tax=Aspergillus udagawae TaxID=91492 RepID=A0ABQ1AYX8_9EURO|nr:hypothetical protein IFM51744_02079 [Aspergillus udagawae]GFF90631.1 hypothetical protein IFM53868_06229 [Aspergillus udagawae]GFG18897.1 hypothetical protein IFM5058_09482 [Aspergillus udagawae]
MSNESRGGPGLLDLEKELTCSICTELLYQPLTLLNCLHTFCGSCLKEWFAAQASRRRPSSSTPQFTCPACRAVVRETRPNATVTTLLDMVLAANPERVKSAEEKEEIAQKYKHGESVFPAIPSPGQDGTVLDDEDRRLLEEVRELSLRESRTGTGQSSRSIRAESVDADGRRADGRSRRRREEEERALRRQPAARTEDNSQRTRRIEHQSSLRSLLSLSDTETMEEEILRQIIEDGLLNDIDLDNLGPAQEEELTERIADAYRRRHMRRPRTHQRQEANEALQTSPRPRARSQSVQRPPTVSAPQTSSRNPPVSRPYLLEPLVSRSDASNHQRRLSDQGTRRRRTSPAPANAASTSEVTLRPAARSSSDIASDRPRPSQSSRARAAELSAAPRPRRATASEQNVPTVFNPEARNRDHRQHVSGRPLNISPASVTSPSTPNNSFSSRLEQTTAGSSVCSSLAPAVSSPANQRSRPSSSRSQASQRPLPTFTEPSISCDRCGKQNIQYDLHRKCLQCKDGNFNLCLRCYRLGHGCLQWAGFGPSAEANFDRMLASSTGRAMPSREIAHVLQFSRYSRPSENVHRTTSGGTEMTSDDPAQRLQTGFFCDICHAVANKCYWKCNECNQGDWGFCNKCVNQGRCCTHALLPICRLAPGDRSSAPVPTSSDSTDGPNDPSSSSTSTDNGNEIYRILSFSTKCDICTYPIPASATRFHCLECNGGDYDVCANCYLKLVATGKISKENGHNGWRRCVKGHRMVVVGFEDHDEGQRRVVVRDLVGGRALKDEHAAAIPSPEVGSGDWSWKDGSERRKKASRVRTSWTTIINDRSNSFPISATGGSGSGSGPNSETATPTSSHSPPFLRRFPPDGGIGLIVHALWSWYPEDDVQDELMFPRGAEITEVENINDDWFWGCYAGQTGLFPGSHVTVVGEIV